MKINPHRRFMHFMGWLNFLSVCLAFVSCIDIAPTKEVCLVDSLNTNAYDWRYRDLSRSEKIASDALSQAHRYHQGKAESCNHLGFVAFMRMDFPRAIYWYDKVAALTQNELELLIADIGRMKVCQRTGQNKAYYDYRNTALKRMKRIQEDSNVFDDPHETVRLNYAFSEFHITSAIYYYYMQQREEAIHALNQLQSAWLSDQSQSLFAQYIRASAHLYSEKNREDGLLAQFDDLYEVWQLSENHGYAYLEGNSLQGMAELLIPNANSTLILSQRRRQLRQMGIPLDSLLAFRIGEKALNVFTTYEDQYQIAAAHVTLSKYLNANGHYSTALDTLTKALQGVSAHHQIHYHEPTDSRHTLVTYQNNDTLPLDIQWLIDPEVLTVPEWISSIREQLSVAYAGLNNKEASDYNRNIYLDILNDCRQDKELENRYDFLARESQKLNGVLLGIAFILIGSVLLFFILNQRSRRRNKQYLDQLHHTLNLSKDITLSSTLNLPSIQIGLDHLLGNGKVGLQRDDDGHLQITCEDKLRKDQKALLKVLTPFIRWTDENEHALALINEEREQIEEQRYVYEQHIVANKRQNIVKRACLAVAGGLQPFIDRILSEVHKLTDKGYIHDSEIKKEKYQYIDELVSTINEYNDILALWIRMRQGAIGLHIEQFNLQDLFDIISKSRHSYELKQLHLSVIPSDIRVKADKALTLFMINTLAENARKYTPAGGEVRIYAEATDTYAEISIADTGIGLSKEDISHILGEKIYDSSQIGLKSSVDPEQLKHNKGQGFGLMNCKGIIEKYRKTNALFDVCTFQIESTPHQGSRFFFRLPLGVRKALLLLFVTIQSTLLLSSCHSSDPSKANYVEETMCFQNDTMEISQTDSIYDAPILLASDYANMAYYANVDRNYEQALCYIDTAFAWLNDHHETYADSLGHSLRLISDDIPAEQLWWNDLYDTDYHVILDLRNEAAVALLALKQLDGYYYNNDAFQALYKLQSEDHTLATYCQLLARQASHKVVGVVFIVLLLLIVFMGYYFFYVRRRRLHIQSLKQVLEIAQTIFAAADIRQVLHDTADQTEEQMLEAIPQRLVDHTFASLDELLNIDAFGLVVTIDSRSASAYASYPQSTAIPPLASRCIEHQKRLTVGQSVALPLLIEQGSVSRCVGALYVERTHTPWSESDLILLELIASYISIAVSNAIIKLAMQYRDLETAHDESQRALWEDNQLHVQNMVLDNCLSTIKHETVYYPNRIKQIVQKLYVGGMHPDEELQCVHDVSELIDYYKSIYNVLYSCASRQMDEITFRRETISVDHLLQYAVCYFRKKMKKIPSSITLDCRSDGAFSVTGDISQLEFLLENLIDEALSFPSDGSLMVNVYLENNFVRFEFADYRRSPTDEDIHTLFYPRLSRLSPNDSGAFTNAPFLICKQIIREHDEFGGRRGCRINAERIKGSDTGYQVYFTLPQKKLDSAIKIKER